jgi:hypothetical protein
VHTLGVASRGWLLELLWAVVMQLCPSRILGIVSEVVWAGVGVWVRGVIGVKFLRVLYC